MRPRGARAAASAVSAALLALALSCSTGDAVAPPSSAAPSAGPGDPVVVNEEDGSGGTLRLGLVAPDTIDPAQIYPTDPAQAVTADLLFDGLTSIDPQSSEAVPAIATAWTPDDALTTWTFQLRPDATFSDGSAITADDVKFSLERVVLRGRLAIAGPRLDVIAGYKDLLTGASKELAGVVATDEHTVTITLAGPFAALPELLASPSFGIVSKAVASSGLPQVVLSGGFDLVSRDDTTARLEKRDGAAVKLDAVELHRYTDDAAAWSAYGAGEIDWVLVPADKRDEAIEKYGTASFTPLGATSFIGLNLVNPKFSDKRFRRALLLALDRNALAAVAPAGRVPQLAIVPPGVPGALGDGCGEPCRFDREEARKILGLVFPSGVVPAIALAVPSGGVEEAVAKEVERQLAEVDVPVIISAMDFADYRSFRTSGQQEMFWYGWAGLFPDPDAYLGRLFPSTSTDNNTGFSSAEVDADLAAARATKDRTERFDKYREVERQAMDEVTLIPVAAYQLEAVVSSDVRNLRWRLDGTFVAADVWVKG